MMRNAIYIFLVIFLVVSSCTDLEEKIYDKVPTDEYPENPDQVATLAVSAYNALTDLIDDAGWWFLAQEITGDGFCAPTRDTDWDDGGKWVAMHRHSWTNDTEGVNRMWSAMWAGVTKSNITIDQLKALPQDDAVLSKIAEVEVLRSFFYYLLIDNYGDVPYLTTTLGVPENPYKISRTAVFDSLTTTIEQNLGKLKNIDRKYMVTKNVGYALLAKLYLNAEVYTGMSEWVKAEAYTDSVLAGPYSLEPNLLAPFVTDNGNSSEIIFAIAFDEDLSQGFRLHMRSLHYQHNLKYDMNVGPWNGLCITPVLWDLYDDTDERKSAYNIYGYQLSTTGDTIIDEKTKTKLNIKPILPALVMAKANFTLDEITNTGARVQKYEIKMGAKENLSNDFPLFRISDFYLMKAELAYRTGSGAPDAWINPIRMRAGTGSSSGFTLNDILDERARELYVEGHRRQDLIRFDKFTDAWWEKGGTYDGTAGDPSVKIFPIPKWATDANPNLLLDPQ